MQQVKPSSLYFVKLLEVMERLKVFFWGGEKDNSSRTRVSLKSSKKSKKAYSQKLYSLSLQEGEVLRSVRGEMLTVLLLRLLLSVLSSLSTFLFLRV